MKSSKTILLAALLALGLGCGYSAKSTTPAVAGTMPTVSALAPSSVTAGSPSFVLTVNGTNFNGNAAINLNGTAQMTSHVSANQLTATVPAASVATAGTVTVTVTNPGIAGGIYGGGTAAETSNSMTFTIN
jgi:type IV pilus biogenesis protein CpaD/CtpE